MQLKCTRNTRRGAGSIWCSSTASSQKNAKAPGLSSCARALARDSESPALLAALAHCLVDKGRLDEGLACCRTTLAVEPDHHDARLARGRANFLTGRWAGAFREVRRELAAKLAQPDGAQDPRT